MATRTVTAHWVNADGSGAANALSTFELDPSTFSAEEMVLDTTVQAPADTNGYMAQPLWVNEDGLEPTRYTVTWPTGRQDEFVLPPGDNPISLRELLGMNLVGWTTPTDETAIDVAISGVYDSLASAEQGDALIGYSAMAPGAYSRTVHDKLTLWIDFLDFVDPVEHAAILDGSSLVDHSAELAAFVAALGATGGRAIGYLPAGTITFSTGIELRGVHLYGATRDHTLLNYTGSGTAITIADTGNPSLLHDVKIQGPDPMYDPAATPPQVFRGRCGVLCKRGESSGVSLKRLRIWGFNYARNAPTFVPTAELGIGLNIDAYDPPPGLPGGNYYSVVEQIHIRDCCVGVRIGTTGYTLDPENPDELPPDVEATRTRFANAQLLTAISSNQNRIAFLIYGASGNQFFGCSAEHNDDVAFDLYGSVTNAVIGGWYEFNPLGHIRMDQYSRSLQALGAQWSAGSRSMPISPVVGAGAAASGNAFIMDYTRTALLNYTDDTWRVPNYAGFVQALRLGTLYTTGSAYIDVIRPRQAIYNGEYLNTVISRYRRGPRYQYSTVTVAIPPPLDPLVPTNKTVIVSNTDDTGAAMAGFPPSGTIKIQQTEHNAYTTTIANSVNNGDGTTTITLTNPMTGGADVGNQVYIMSQLEDAFDRLQFRNDGDQLFGSGLAVPDTTLSHIAAGGLNVNHTFQATHLSDQGMHYRKRTISNVDAPFLVATNHSLVSVTGPPDKARSVVLPPANAVAATSAQVVEVTVKDESGNCATYPITVSVSDGGQIDGATTLVISTNYAARTFYSTGVKWFTGD